MTAEQDFEGEPAALEDDRRRGWERADRLRAENKAQFKMLLSLRAENAQLREEVTRLRDELTPSVIMAQRLREAVEQAESALRECVATSDWVAAKFYFDRQGKAG